MKKTTGHTYWIFRITVVLFILTTTQVFTQPLASGHDKFLGNVFPSGNPPDKFETYWNQVTPENSGKWGSVESTRGVYAWSALDMMYQYCQQRGIPFKYHCLVWGQQQPAWITTLDTASQAREVEEYIRLVGERYPNMYGIDVVNEGLPGHNPAQYRNALGGAGTTGYNWIITAFRWARQYCAPGVRLILNDYGIINDDNATTSYLVIINLLKDRGLIDGIGVQGHRFEFENTPTTTLKRNLDRLAATGIPIYITEFDVAPHNTVDEAVQQTEMQRIFPTLWTHPGVKGITFWGYLAGSIWQAGAELLNSDGSERLAMQWLRDYLTASGSYRSHRSGLWNDLSTWEIYDGASWNTPVLSLPDPSSKIVTVKTGDTITVALSDSIDQLWLSQGASLIVSPGATLSVKHGDPLDVSGADMFINGSVKCYGTLAARDGAIICFGNGSSYKHEQNGGALPIAVWKSGSVCILDALTNSVPANGNQNFYNITWNSPGQTDNLSMGWNGNAIGGAVTIQNTGSAVWQFCRPAAGENDTVRIDGDIVQTGGQVAAGAFSGGQASVTVIQKGNFRMTGGNFSLGTGSGGSCSWYLDGGFVSIRNAGVQNDIGSTGKFIFSGNDVSQNLTLSGVAYGPGGLPIEVDSGAILNIGTSVLKGEGRFSLKPGATIQTGHAGGLDSSIQTTGSRTFSTSAKYVYSGIRSQVTGSLLPDTVAGLTLNCSPDLTLSKNLVVTDTLDIKRGSLTLGGNTLTYGPNAVLKYSGLTAQTTSDAEFPASGGPINLTTATQNGLTLHSSRTIPGIVTPTTKLTLGANTLTASSASDGTTTGYVVTNGDGMLRLVSAGTGESFFPVGTASAYAPVCIGYAGTSDTLGAKVTADASPSPYGGRVNMRWTLATSIAGSGNYALRFGWLPSSESSVFRANRSGNAKIFRLDDSTEAGSGQYTSQFSTTPYTIWRGGMTQLGTFGVGIFGTVTSAIADQQSEIPGAFELRQNYPNPFNPTTTIGYVLPTESNITITIYNVLGAKIRTLVDKRQPTGSYSVTWDGADDQHHRVASGLYFYTLRTAGGTITKKMLLLK